MHLVANGVSYYLKNRKSGDAPRKYSRRAGTQEGEKGGGKPPL